MCVGVGGVLVCRWCGYVLARVGVCVSMFVCFVCLL